MPEGTPQLYAVVGPCFTCVKESNGALKISRALAARGIAALRFDTTGVGESEGVLAETNFTTRIADILAANAAIEKEYAAPRLFVGHSISGTAALSAGKHLPHVEVIATVGSPSDPAATIEKFRQQGLMQETQDSVTINVIGRPVVFAKSFVDDMLSQTVVEDTAKMAQKLIIFHAPNDAIVSWDNAETLKMRAGNKAELVRLADTATHLLERGSADADFIADKLARAFD